jgi:hypothetical protein
MILVNSQKATLRKFNRNTYNYEQDNFYDDQNYTTETIKVVPYNVDQAIRFGIYTIPEATGYYMVNRDVDVREGDQIIFIGKFLNTKMDLTEKILTVLKVEDAWNFNRVENKMVIVK